MHSLITRANAVPLLHGILYSFALCLSIPFVLGLVWGIARHSLLFSIYGMSAGLLWLMVVLFAFQKILSVRASLDVPSLIAISPKEHNGTTFA